MLFFELMQIAKDERLTFKTKVAKVSLWVEAVPFKSSVEC